MERIYYNMASEFSVDLGPRKIEHGNFSGERFRDYILIPLIEKDSTITLDFNDVLTAPSSFLEETFGGLIRKGFKLSDINKRVEIISEEDPWINEMIIKYLKEADEKINKK